MWFILVQLMNYCQEFSNANSTKGSNIQAVKVLNIKGGNLKGDDVER